MGARTLVLDGHDCCHGLDRTPFLPAQYQYTGTAISIVTFRHQLLRYLPALLPGPQGHPEGYGQSLKGLQHLCLEVGLFDVLPLLLSLTDSRGQKSGGYRVRNGGR
jgi:hypothetical protein